MKLKEINLSFCVLILFSSLNNVTLAGAEKNPFSPKAYLIRYWNSHIAGKASSPPPEFFLSKASPLTAADSAVFADLAAKRSLPSRLPEFCSAARLLCSSAAASSAGAADFASYVDRNFTRYGESRRGEPPDSFRNYTAGEAAAAAFQRYSRGSADHREEFSSYVPDANEAVQTFASYGTDSSGGSGDFKLYANGSNVPIVRFASYSKSSEGRKQKFKGYGEDDNFAAVEFVRYGKSGDGATADFSTYSSRANLANNVFRNYGRDRRRGRDGFNSYIKGVNLGVGNFTSYGDGGDGSAEEFKNYRVAANQGEDSFTSYAKHSRNVTVGFAVYGKSIGFGESNFTSYGGGDSAGESIGFKVYGDLFSFREYADGKRGVIFSAYNVTTNSEDEDGSFVNSFVEPGKFFREARLKEGTVMPMPDIEDKMPKRSFLPRAISSKLPFSTSELTELTEVFNGAERMMTETLTECEAAPSRGETKRCVSSAEDMIDFATSVLGRNVVVRTTESVSGSRSDVMVGSVRGVNGGRVTKSVSCHQSLFPYLVYYCHSVPKVRVYEADILDPVSKVKINHGVAICHVDTSAWGPTHGAFLALGSGPGRIEVCHWIFENDMTWNMAD